MSLEGHNQVKKKNIKTIPAGWIGASTRAELNTTQQLRLVGLGHRRSRTTRLNETTLAGQN